MLPQEIIRTKRDGGTLDRDALTAFVRGVGEGTVTDAHIAAFTMAVFLRGMSTGEIVGLTTAMRDSGTVLRWNLPGPVLDKHSTGGVGDTVSLVLAPIVAACGGFVPMISGRGLGHTGGTLDKMASIPGYAVSPPLARFRRVVASTGCAIIGQTADLAPADGRIYAVRDVTATVESIPLITASILSKKLAAGLDALVMDVKAGNGAFMATRRDAGALARSIVSVANGAGMPTEALVTDMDQPLADVAGNALEVAYAIEHLTGERRDSRFIDVTLSLAAKMLLLGRLARTPASARRRAQQALDSGEAAERFARMVVALGGPRRLLEHPWQHLPRAAVERAVSPTQAGTVRSIDTRAVGLAVVALGGGRTRPSDPVDPSVGLTRLAAIGDRIDADRPIAVVHARTSADAETAAAHLRAAYRIGTPRTPAPRR